MLLLVVADAVNSDVTLSYPASYDLDNIISVGAITSAAAVSSFSNYGATTVDIFAPGSGITSSIPDATYATWDGTSKTRPICAWQKHLCGW